MSVVDAANRESYADNARKNVKVAEMTDPSLEHDPLGELAEEFLERLRRGEHPSVSEYVRRYPQMSERIQNVFPTLAMVEDLGASLPGRSGLPGAPLSVDPLVPPQIGDYRIVREIGRGGMGIVYEAEQVSLKRSVALKLLFSPHSDYRHAWERLQREARVTARLHHTNIVSAFHVGEQNGQCYLAMQFIRGRPLDDVICELRRLRDARSESVTTVGNSSTSPFEIASITINPVNDPPIGFNLSFATDRNVSLTGVLAADDGDPEIEQALSFSIVVPPEHGQITSSGIDPTTGEFTFTYEPESGFTGADFFLYEVTDDTTAGGSAMTSERATAILIVRAPDRPPVADSQSITPNEDTPTPFALTGSDPDGDALRFILLNQPQHGRISNFDTTTGQGIYEPDRDFDGTAGPAPTKSLN